VRALGDGDTGTILAIVNAAAEAYRGVIPADRWHEPYMDAAELRAELAAGVQFSAYEADGDIVGVMGIQPVRKVELIRHAYVLPAWQGRGVGRELMRHLLARVERQVLVGTWAAATWAIVFHERNGFRLVPEPAKALLLRAYWTIPERQADVSVVLAAPPLTLEEARTLAA
jgi:GNAT superfamily N-acetyltransferase